MHEAVIDLLAEGDLSDLSFPAVAERAGVSASSIYRRWRTREGLLADVAVAWLERDLPLPDTGTLRGDLTAWASAAAARLDGREGRVFLLALLGSWPASGEAEADRRAHLQRRVQGLENLLGRAADRGENPPDALAAAEHVLGPLYFRSMWGIPCSDPKYPRSLVERLLGMRTAEALADGRPALAEPAPSWPFLADIGDLGMTAGDGSVP